PRRPRGGLAPQPPRSAAVAGAGARQPRSAPLPSPSALGVPGTGRLRAADLEPVAARRPAAPLEPQLRGVLSAELAGSRGRAVLCDQSPPLPPWRDRLRGRLEAGAPSEVQPRSRGARGGRVRRL